MHPIRVCYLLLNYSVGEMDQLNSDWTALAVVKFCSHVPRPHSPTSGVARTSRMLGHSTGTLHLYKLLCEVQKHLGGLGHRVKSPLLDT